MNYESKSTVASNLEIAGEYFSQSIAKFECEEYDEAEKLLYLSLDKVPNQLSTLTNLCIVLIKQEKFSDAFIFCDRAIKLHPEDHTLFLIQGQLFEYSKDLLNALDSYNKSLSLNPGFIEAADFRHNLLFKIREFDELLDKGTVAARERRFDEALFLIQKATELDSANSFAQNNYGNILYETHNFYEALEKYDIAINSNPNYYEAYYNKGNALNALNRIDEALDSYRAAIRLKNDYAKAYFNIGNVLKKKNDFKGAYNNYATALVHDPDLEYCFGALVHIKMIMCEWHDIESDTNKMIKYLHAGKKVTTSFPMLCLVDSGELQKKAAEIYMNDINPAKFILGDVALSTENNKIKLGYFSADFREHAVSYLMAELFERHDKSKFELIGFNYGPLDNSLLHKRISSAFDKFLNVQNLSDLQIAKLSREMHIDIAIDLTGITNDGREDIFSYRAAPLQISYLGYLGTMGINYYDYLIADKSIIPEVYQKHYVEKIIYLPSYQVNDNNRDISNRIFTRKELNLPENSFVFCCLNSSFKITSKMFDIWIDILKAVPNSVLLLLAPNPWVQDNLKNEAEIRGFDSNRLVFCNYLKQDEYLARYKCVDLFLDTFPYNAGTTASDVLRIGVPILTLAGESFASRVATSVLTSMHLDDLVTHNLDQYASIAIELATNPLKFKAIKTKLMDRKLSSSLYDTKKFTSTIEKAFCKVYERYKLNLPVEHIYIE